MLDLYMRPIIDPPLYFISKYIVARKVSANTITSIGFLLGVVAIILISMAEYNMAIVFICLNRLCDGLDGAVARHTGSSDFGGFLDIVADFIIYTGVVFGFGIANPEQLFYATFLIFSFIGPMVSFLGYAIIAAKRQISSSKRGKKSFYYLGGICEGTETIVVLLLICIAPNYFNIICIVYGVLCWLTTVGRVYRAWHDFKL